MPWYCIGGWQGVGCHLALEMDGFQAAVSFRAWLYPLMNKPVSIEAFVRYGNAIDPYMTFHGIPPVDLNFEALQTGLAFHSLH